MSSGLKTRKGSKAFSTSSARGGDGEWLFLSSANLPGYAFSLNMELGLLVRGGKLPHDVAAHFDSLISQRSVHRGLNIDTLWADELACWQWAESTWDLAMLALRAGTNPQALITTTPRRLTVLKRILAELTTVQTTDSTYANQSHLPPEFLSQIVGLYANTRLGRQEIFAEFLETTDGVWFANFDPARHVTVDAEYHPGYLVRVAIDAGTSRHTAAVFFQVRDVPNSDRKRVTVFGDYHAVDVVSQKNARAIRAVADRASVSWADRPGAAGSGGLGPVVAGPDGVFGIRARVWPALRRPLAAAPGFGRAGYARAAAG